jgi:LPXTG-motif cell wall-anchored protein
MTTNTHASRVLSSLAHVARPAAATGLLATLLLSAAGAAQAAGHPATQGPGKAQLKSARQAVTSAQTQDVLSRFFARDGALLPSAAAPHVEGATVPVFVLGADFVKGTDDAPVAQLAYTATKAVSSDGQVASVWSARVHGHWKTVNIATGDDETKFAAAGAQKAAGGTVFTEPQIDAWYVRHGNRILPLDDDARAAIGTSGVSVDAYYRRVHAAYADKLPGTAYAREGMAGGFGPYGSPADAAPARGADEAASRGSGPTGPASAAAVGAAGAALTGGSVWLLRRRRSAARR